MTKGKVIPSDHAVSQHSPGILRASLEIYQEHALSNQRSLKYFVLLLVIKGTSV